jgi:phosphoglucosamine mutase
VDPEKKKSWDKNPAVLEHIAKQEQKFGKEGRILVRASGTEPLIRIMTEGREKNQVEEIAAETRAFLETILL